MLLQVENYGVNALILITVIVSGATALAAFFITRSIYKSTLPSRLAEITRQNYEAEKARGDRLEAELTVLKDLKKTWDSEKASLVLDYTQLTQLYAKKSVILEALIPIFGNMADLAERGRITEFLKAVDSPLAPEQGGEIHKTKG